jgi:hypothetical protein
LALLVDDLTMTGLTEGETRTASSPAMTAFIQNYSGSDLVTLLLVAGNTSGGQFTFSSKEAVATSTGVLTGSAGDLAPYLSFTVGQMTPPDLKFSVSGDGATIDFSWTGSYRLQSQTNGLNTGLSTNWVDYPGGTSSPVSVPVDEVQGAVFFRLAQ